MKASTDRKLTPKQERFCKEYIKTGNKSKAYRIAYDAENMAEDTINSKATLLSQKGNVRASIEKLQAKATEKYDFTIDKAVKFDTQLIEHYQSLLKVLNSPKSTDKQIEVAKRTMRYIGTPAYNGAMDRVAKMKGLFERDNNQKKSEVNVFQIPDNERE